MKSILNAPLYGPYGAASLENAKALKEYGVNAVWFHGFDEDTFRKAVTQIQSMWKAI